MTWDEIYERAEGAGCGELPLEAKDEARWQTRDLMVDLGYLDPEQEEIPEESIEEYCEKMQIEFDDCGNIISIQFPEYIMEMVYRQKDDEYLRNDIMNELEKRKDLPEVTGDIIDRMMLSYRKIADCNVPYNSSIEAAVDLILKGDQDGESN